MFFNFSIVITALIVCIAIIQLALAAYFYWLVKRAKQSAEPSSETLPHASGLASVVMSVRGCDPTLRFAIEAVLEQDYENYDIHLVVDHRDDSAWSVAHALKDRFDTRNRMTIHEMREPVETCGLKCNALIQALDHIDPATDYLVLIDADVTPHANWLHQLLTPLSDPEIGVVTGNQWFDPFDASAGSLIRSLWNAGALVPTAIYHNPWAGTFAMRMNDVRRARLAEIWQQSVVDDGPIRQAILPLGLKIHFQPSLIMVNRERCTFGYVNTYITRMLTWSKLYETTFINTVIHALVSNGLLLAALAVAVLAWLGGQPLAAAIALIAFVSNSFISVAAYSIVRSGVNHSCSLRNQSLPRMTVRRLLQLTLLVPVTQFIYGISCFRAIVSQQVKWREITYEVKGKSQVRMLDYAPMLTSTEKAQSKVSI